MVVLEERLIWLCHAQGAARIMPNHVTEMLFPLFSYISVSCISEIQGKVILFLQQCFLLHFDLQIKKKSLSPARPWKKGLIFKKKCLCFLNSTTALLRAQARPRRNYLWISKYWSCLCKQSQQYKKPPPNPKCRTLSKGTKKLSPKHPWWDECTARKMAARTFP